MREYRPASLGLRSSARPESDTRPLHDLVQLLGGDTTALAPGDEHIPVALRRLDEDTVLALEGAALHSLHIVRCGSLKSVRTLEDGYEQVTAFALPGDVLGFDGLHTGRHTASAVALEVSTVYALPLAGLQELRQRCPALDSALQLALSRQLARAAATAEMLAAVASEVRLARFILWMAARVTELGWSPRRMRLRMCRRDIASLLGMAHETVSRSFTTMADTGLLKVDNREVEILDLPRLQARARATRGAPDGSAILVSRGLRGLATARPGPAWCQPGARGAVAPA
jgi:CRP/FNR family transcriptional regulator, anaerobic regulatory protein